ncbi:MAG: hypothetical protein JRF15_07965 [Deltaproteobacteria bacterium]|jgi:hypothetical protein|nr:hypothetical protein [Deltaproteobacteria bacterium]
MRPFQSRQVILAFVACAVAAGSLLVIGSAQADMALFRVEQRWYDSPNPPMTTPGGAGTYQAYIHPYYVDTPHKLYLRPPATAIVEPGNPIGGAFTLPTGFINVIYTFTIGGSFPVWPGYTTYFYVSYYNGPGGFGPNHGATGPTRIVFPTTMGNPYPTYTSTHRKWISGNYGDGDPVTPTTTFDGRYDLSRGGSITVTPGPRRFGGTMKIFYGPNAGFDQYIYYFWPAYYKAYGNYLCFDEGKFGCAPSTFASDIGDTTAYLEATWYRLNVTGTGTGAQTKANTAKATTPTTPSGAAPTPYGNASFITGMRRYLNLIHPWTTGFAKVHNAKGSAWRFFNPEPITPQAQGYDISLGDVTLSVKKRNYNWVFNKTLSTITTTTSTPFTQVLKGVTRVVSMVRPRLVHDYNVPVGSSADPITNIWQAARLHTMRVFFLPEPTGMLMLGAGIAALLGLSRMRWR